MKKLARRLEQQSLSGICSTIRLHEKKFMKTPATEGSYIYDLVCRIAMSHPEISFQFIMNSADKLFTSGNGKLKDIIYHIYGRDITNNLLEIDAENENVHITGYLAKPSISRGNRAFEDYYVNRRYIKSNILTKAIEDAYRTFVMVHKFPFTVLNFEINPALIDVNIHPAKRELKFMNEPDIYDFTYISVRKALLFKELIPEVTPGKDARPQTLASRKLERKPEPFEANRRAAETTGQNEPIQQNAPTSKQMKPIQQDAPMAVQTETTRQNEPIKSMPTVSTPIQNQDTVLSAQNKQIKQDAPMSAQKELVHQEPVPEMVQDSMQAYQVANPVSTDAPKKETYQQLDMFEHKFLDSEARKKHRIIGQVFQTYWLIEYEDKFFIMDQHAAHEKVKFEELMENYKNKSIVSQYLMPPAVVTLSGAEAEFLREHLDFFHDLGFEIEGFGGKEYKLSAVPANLFGLDGRELFLEFIGELSENGQKTTIDVFISKLSTMACKAAIKGNTVISTKEADALIDQLLKLENPYTCPHGRPTLISMTERELEKKFKRIV